jgi:hypothetical protein
MAYIRIIDPEQATGNRADYYSQISESYTASLGFSIEAPQVYRPHSILEPYLKLGAMQVSKTSSEEAYLGEGTVPQLLVNFGVAINSSCFY